MTSNTKLLEEFHKRLQEYGLPLNEFRLTPEHRPAELAAVDVGAIPLITREDLLGKPAVQEYEKRQALALYNSVIEREALGIDTFSQQWERGKSYSRLSLSRMIMENGKRLRTYQDIFFEARTVTKGKMEVLDIGYEFGADFVNPYMPFCYRVGRTAKERLLDTVFETSLRRRGVSNEQLKRQHALWSPEECMGFLAHQIKEAYDSIITTLLA